MPAEAAADATTTGTTVARRRRSTADPASTSGSTAGVPTPVRQQFSEGGCGFFQRCIYFNRTEQQYLISGSKWIVQAALCAASIGLGCVAAGLIVELAAQWLLSRGGDLLDQQAQAPGAVVPQPAGRGVRSVMAMDSPVRRMVAVLGVLLVVGVATSIWRGDSVATTVGTSLVGLACGGFVFACYFWARRKS